jgi:hypothetical protein
MLAQDLPSARRRSDRDRPAGSRPVGEGCRHAVAIALEVTRQVGETRLVYSTKPSKGRPSRHQAAQPPRPRHRRRCRAACHAGSRAHCSMQRSSSQALSASRSGKLGMAATADGAHPGRSSRPVPSPSPRPDCRTRARTGSGWPSPEARVDLPLLAAADLVDRGLHVVVDPARGTPPSTRNA